MNDDPTEIDGIAEDEVELSSVDGEQTAPEPGGESIEGLQAEVEKLQSELANAKEQFLRAQAEVQNVKRRAAQDVEKAHKFALEKFVGDLLPVADNLERAVDAATQEQGDFATIAEGADLTLKTLVDALKRHSVEQVDPAGEPFDPQLHQAMATVDNPDVEPNTVIEVFQRGYTLSGRLVRPAMVVVSKGS